MEATETVTPVEMITMKQAHEIAKQAGHAVSLQTIHFWVDKNKLGFQPAGPGGHWKVFKEKFTKHVSGESALNAEAE